MWYTTYIYIIILLIFWFMLYLIYGHGKIHQKSVHWLAPDRQNNWIGITVCILVLILLWFLLLYNNSRSYISSIIWDNWCKNWFHKEDWKCISNTRECSELILNWTWTEYYWTWREVCTVRCNEGYVFIINECVDHDTISKIINNNASKNQKDKYEVERVIDWDTIVILSNNKLTKIRLLGINTPEIDQKISTNSECFAFPAKDYLNNLLLGKVISLEFDESQWTYDKYWRLLAYIYLGNININQQMISKWYAREYLYDKPYKYMSVFQKSESDAKNLNLWLWKDCK